LFAKGRIGGILAAAVGAEHLRPQLFEQHLGLFQIGQVKAFGEPGIDFGEYRARFVAAVRASLD
jgi:hypothetical protein